MYFHRGTVLVAETFVYRSLAVTKNVNNAFMLTYELSRSY